MSGRDTYPEGTLIDGRYRIERTLGHGGFATVYQAEHIQLGRKAAIKVLEPVALHESERYHARFNAEARIAANLDHPNVVRIFDFGVIGDSGRPYMAMELLDGCDLQDYLADHGPLEPERAKRLFLPVIDALRVGHERGIIHKDLKPANLFLVKAGTPDEKLIVLDYGIARLEAENNPRYTEDGTYTGTPAYMAPEYIHRREIIPANDVYQIGLIFIESLTGQAVVQARSHMAYFVAHVNAQRQLPDGFADTELGAALLKAIEVEPANRFRDAGEMSRAIERTRIETGADFTLPRIPTLDPSHMPVPVKRDAAAGETDRGVPPHRKSIAPIVVAIACMLGAATCVTAGLLLYAFSLAYDEAEADYMETAWLDPSIETMIPPVTPFPHATTVSELDEMHGWLLTRYFVWTILDMIKLYDSQRKTTDWPEVVSFVPTGVEDLMSIAHQQVAIGMQSPPKRAKLESLTPAFMAQVDATRKTLVDLYDYHTVFRGWEQDNGARGVTLSTQLQADHAKLSPLFATWSTEVDAELLVTLARADDIYANDPFMRVATEAMRAEAKLMVALAKDARSAATKTALGEYDRAFNAVDQYVSANREQLAGRYSITAGLHERYISSLRETRRLVATAQSGGLVTPALMQLHLDFNVYRSLGQL